MCSLKLIELSIQSGVCTKENGLKNMDLDILGAPYTPFSCQVSVTYLFIFKKSPNLHLCGCDNP